MAQFTPIYVSDQIRKNRLVCWSISDRGGLITSQDDPTINADDSAGLFLEEVENIGNGLLTVKASAVEKSQRKGAEAHRIRTFTINLDAEKKTGGTIAGHGPGVEKLHHQILELERDKLKLKYELEAARDIIDKLKAEIKELEESEPEEESIGGIKFSDVIQWAMAAGKPAAPGPGIAGPPAEVAPEVTAFYNAEPEAARVLRCILNLKKRDPMNYALIKFQLFKNYAL